MPNKKMKKDTGRKAVLFRLIRMLFSFYPVLLPITLICILFNAVISSIPSVFMQNVIAAVEKVGRLVTGEAYLGRFCDMWLFWPYFMC